MFEDEVEMAYNSGDCDSQSIFKYALKGRRFMQNFSNMLQDCGRGNAVKIVL